MPERWLNVEEIAKHLGVAPITIYRWLEKESVPAHRIGKLWKFKATEVDDWVKRGEASAKRTTSKRTGESRGES